MASKRKRANGTWEFVIKRARMLPGPVSMTFDTEAEGERVCARLEALLDAGIVPPDLAGLGRERIATLGALVREYLRAVPVKVEDESLLSAVLVSHGATALASVTYDWAEAWVLSMKRERRLAPGTIRKYIGAVARCCDWGANKGIAGVLTHPFRRLPRGYSTYTRDDLAVLAAAGKQGRRDVERDRRLQAGEEEAIERVLRGEKPDGRQRALTLPDGAAQLDLQRLALDSCMRMREMFTITADQVDFAAQSVNLDRTKNGDKRQVPIMTDRMEEILRRRCEMAGPGAVLFPWWSGQVDAMELRRVTNLLSHRFKSAYLAAGCEDLTFHDLRHEATSRLVETTELSDTECMRITGHKDPKMFRRYANLRPSRLVDKIRRGRKA